MKILVISLAGIGDTLFATPLIHELRENFPSAIIDALVLWPGSKQVLEGNPYVNTVYQKNLLTAPLLESLEFLRNVRRHAYDISFNAHPQGKIHYRMVARLIGARQRISHRYGCSEVLDRFLINRSLPQDYKQHCVYNDLALMELIGAKRRLAEHRYEIFLSPSEEAWANAFVTEHGLTGRKLLGLHVGSGGTKNLPLRRWPAEHYVELIRQLNRERPEATVLLFGGPEEKQAHQIIHESAGSPMLLQPETRNIRQAAALIAKCDAFLSVDTALMHMAAAVRVKRQIVIETPTFNPTVEPFGQHFVLVPNPEVAGRNLEFYKYDGGDIKGTPDELRRCMASVKVEAVLAAVKKALG